MTIKEAIELLRTVVPARERTVAITIEVMDYDHYDLNDPQRCRAEFRVWDGRTGYYGPTLETAVQKAMLGNVPDRGTVDAAEPFMGEMETLLASRISETDTEAGGHS